MNLSVLEIIIYILLGIAFTVWTIINVKKYLDHKNGKKPKENEEED